MKKENKGKRIRTKNKLVKKGDGGRKQDKAERARYRRGMKGEKIAVGRRKMVWKDRGKQKRSEKKEEQEIRRKWVSCR
jgi:hypothetical protein